MCPTFRQLNLGKRLRIELKGACTVTILILSVWERYIQECVGCSPESVTGQSMYNPLWGQKEKKTKTYILHKCYNLCLTITNSLKM